MEPKKIAPDPKKPEDHPSRRSTGPLAIKIQHKDAEAKKQSTIPLIGIFTMRCGGNTRLFCKGSDLTFTNGITYLGQDGRPGTVYDVKLIKEEDKNTEVKNNTTLAGEFQDLDSNDKASVYAGIIDESMVKDPLFTIGMLLAPGSNILATSKGNVEIEYQSSKFTLYHYYSQEGFNVKCMDYASKKILAHYYYYLNSDIQPTQITN